MQVGPARPRGAASRDRQRRGGSRCQAAGFEDTNRGHWPRTADASARRERPGSGVSPRASGRDAALLTRGFRPGGPVPGFRPADGDDCPASLRLSGEHGFPLCLCLTSRTIPSPVPLSQMARTRGAVTAGPAAPRVPGRGPPGVLPTGHGLEDSRQTGSVGTLRTPRGQLHAHKHVAARPLSSPAWGPWEGPARGTRSGRENRTHDAPECLSLTFIDTVSREGCGRGITRT